MVMSVEFPSGCDAPSRGESALSAPAMHRVDETRRRCRMRVEGATDLYSDLARDLLVAGPAVPDMGPRNPIHFRFDGGLAAPESFPLDDLLVCAQRVLDRDGARALEYYDYNAHMGYREGYQEQTLGYGTLRDALAKR